MKWRRIFGVCAAIVFLGGITVGMAFEAEAGCGGCKRKGGRCRSAASQASQAGGSCCSSGPAAQNAASGSSCCAAGVRNVAASPSTADASSCKFCGMNRQQYAGSWIEIAYDGLTPQGTCSLHCAAVELANNTYRRPKVIRVGDFATHKMIDAEKAYWVIGGSKKGVMTETGTWAFGEKQDAEAFVRENGGRIGGFDEALAVVYEDIKSSIKKMRQKL